MPRGLPSKARSAAIGMRVRPRVGTASRARCWLHGIWENARLFPLLNLAMADGYIAGFDSKYYYNYWRRVTAIREGGQSEWLSCLSTPPVPDYPSTHTVEGAAAATVMARFFNTDFSFSMTSGAPYPGITRKFWSFSEAARENGASRVLCGIHFSTAVNAGISRANALGNGLRASIAACKASAGDHRFPRVGKNGTLKLRSIRNIREPLSSS